MGEWVDMGLEGGGETIYFVARAIAAGDVATRSEKKRCALMGGHC